MGNWDYSSTGVDLVRMAIKSRRKPEIQERGLRALATNYRCAGD